MQRTTEARVALEDAKSEIDRAFSGGDPRGLASESTYAGATSFLRRCYRKDLSGADLAVTGIPFDMGVTNRPGARFGPRAIREASCLQPYDPPWGWGFDPLSDFIIIDQGDVAFDYAKISLVPAAIEAHTKQFVEAAVPVLSLGGDHYVTLPILRVHAAKHGPLSVIQFDAHSDLWPDDDPDRIDHGTFMYKAVREGLVDPSRSVQIGIRTVCEDVLGMQQIDARICHERGADWVAARAQEIVVGHPTYLTFDIDALDPAFAPGTGTPVWGGLASWQVAAMLRDLAGIHVVGADVVEVAPHYDPSGATAIAGAHVAMELMCLMLWPRRRVSE